MHKNELLNFPNILTLAEDVWNDGGGHSMEVLHIHFTLPPARWIRLENAENALIKYAEKDNIKTVTLEWFHKRFDDMKPEEQENIQQMIDELMLNECYEVALNRR